MITIPNTYGYIRVSTWEQNEDRQLVALREMAVLEQNIFIDKQSCKGHPRHAVPGVGSETFHKILTFPRAGAILVFGYVIT